MAAKWGQAQNVVGREGQITNLMAVGAFSNAGKAASFKRRMAVQMQSEAESPSATFQSSAATFAERLEEEQVHYNEMLDARCNLRYHPDVVKEVRQWVRAIDRLQRKATGVVSPVFFGPAYKTVFTKICLAMTAKGSIEDLREVAEEEWEHDSRGKESMTVEQLKDGLFELADLWTEDTEPVEYLAFLRILMHTICPAGDFLADEHIVRGAARCVICLCAPHTPLASPLPRTGTLPFPHSSLASGGICTGSS